MGHIRSHSYLRMCFSFVVLLQLQHFSHFCLCFGGFVCFYDSTVILKKGIKQIQLTIESKTETTIIFCLTQLQS